MKIIPEDIVLPKQLVSSRFNENGTGKFLHSFEFIVFQYIIAVFMTKTEKGTCEIERSFLRSVEKDETETETKTPQITKKGNEQIC